LDGSRDVIFQTIEFEGIHGKDFSNRAIPPNRGLLLYRCEIDGLISYYNMLNKKGLDIYQELQAIIIEPYGSVNCFSLKSPNGVLWEFFEKTKS